MRERQIYWALLSLGALMVSFTFVLGHDEPQSKPGRQSSQPAAPKTTASDPQGASLKSDPAAAFTILFESVMRRKDAVELELADLPQYPDLFQFLTAPSNGRYVVKQLVFAKGDEVRALSVALHPPHDMFLTRGKEVGANAFEGIYYVIDRTGWLKGAAARQGKTIKEVSMGDAWQAYESEKAFWIWQAEQIAGSPQAGR